MMITVHHLNNSRSQRILWLLEELGLAYEVRFYQRDPKTMLAPPELLAVHPLGKSPVITEDGRTLAESGAIIEYLLDQHGRGRLRPAAGTPERMQFTYWLDYAEGSAMPPLLLKVVFDTVARRPVPFFVKPVIRKVVEGVNAGLIAPQLKRHMDYWETELRKSDWFAGGEFSAADIQMSFPVEAALQRIGLDQNRPRLMDFIKRIEERPAYQRAAARGGPHNKAL